MSEGGVPYLTKRRIFVTEPSREFGMEGTESEGDDGVFDHGLRGWARMETGLSADRHFGEGGLGQDEQDGKRDGRRLDHGWARMADDHGTMSGDEVTPWKNHGRKAGICGMLIVHRGTLVESLELAGAFTG